MDLDLPGSPGSCLGSLSVSGGRYDKANDEKTMKYKIPQFKLALIKERDGDSTEIFTPSDVEKFVEPLKHFSDYVPKLNMCHS